MTPGKWEASPRTAKRSVGATGLRIWAARTPGAVTSFRSSTGKDEGVGFSKTACRVFGIVRTEGTLERLVWLERLEETSPPGPTVEVHCPGGTMLPVVGRRSMWILYPETDGLNLSPASTISTCCYRDGVPGCSGARAQRRTAAGAQDQLLAVRGPGSVVGRTEGASDDCRTR